MIEKRDSLSAHLACLVDSRVLMAKKGVKAVVSHNCEFHTIKVTPPQLYSMYHSKQFLLTYDIVLLSWLFSNAIGLPSCSSTAPKPTPHASHMTSKSLCRPGNANTGALHRAVFTPAKAFSHFSAQVSFALSELCWQDSHQCSPTHDEFARIVCKAPELLHIGSGPEDWPVLHIGHLLRIHTQSPGSDIVTQKLQLRLNKVAFSQVIIQLVIP